MAQVKQQGSALLAAAALFKGSDSLGILIFSDAFSAGFLYGLMPLSR